MTLSAQSVDLSFMSDLDLRYDNEPYQLSDYDTHNVTMICNSILGGNGDRLIMGPTRLSTMILGSIVSALALIDQHLQSQSDAMHGLLKKGDIVQYKGRRGKYVGTELLGSERKIRIEFKDLVLWIDLSQVWRLTRCASTATRIDNYGKKMAEPSRSPRYILAELLQLEDNDMPPVIPVKLPIVATKKHATYHYCNMFIGNLPCSSLLPAGYYPSADSYERIGKDPLHRDPVICFTSNIGVAADIANRHKDVRGLIVDHLKLQKGDLSHVADLQENSKRIVVLSNIDRIYKDEMHKLNAMGFKITAWTPAELRRVSVRPVSPSSRTSSLLVQAECLLHNAAHGRSNPLIVESDEGNQLGVIRNKLSKVNVTASRCNYTDQFLRSAYGLLMQLACLPLPLEHIKALGSSYESLIQVMTESLINMYTAVPLDVVSGLQEVLNDLAQCVEHHRWSHPKHAKFREAAAELDINSCIVVRSNRDKRILKSWLAECGQAPRVVSLQDALSSEEPERNTLSLGWYGRKHVMLSYSGFCMNEKIIAYPFEDDLRRSSIASTSRQLGRMAGRALPPQKAVQPGASELEELIATITMEWEQALGEVSISTVEGMPVVEASIVGFDEDYIAFVTENHNCRCWDQEGERIVPKKVSELNIGDMLIFVRDSSEDIFRKLTELVKEACPEIREQALLAETWRHAFLSYVDSHNLSPAEFQCQLRQAGVHREVATIRTWQQEDCIGPEDDAIRAIAQITQDPELDANLYEVMAACRHIRSLHIKLGKYLANSIASSIAGDAVLAEEQVLRELTNDLTKHAEVVTVRGIAPEQVRVPYAKANRLLNRFLDL